MNRGGDGVAVRDRKVARSNIPVKGGVVPGRVARVRVSFMIITLPGKDPRPAGVRAARVRCGRSSLRGVAGSDRRRRRVLLRLVRGGRGWWRRRGPRIIISFYAGAARSSMLLLFTLQALPV